MRTNLLIAVSNLIKSPTSSLSFNYNAKNRANSMGDSLEFYVKDLFCNSSTEQDIAKKNEIYSKYFSYLGNQNNPPDIIISQGDAVEIKKIESLGSSIALNSSYPKDKLYTSSLMITASCKQCEK